MPINRFTKTREGLVAKPLSFDDYTRAGVVKADSIARLSQFAATDLTYNVPLEDQEFIGQEVGVVEDSIDQITKSISEGNVSSSIVDTAVAGRRKYNEVFGEKGVATLSNQNKQLIQLWEAKVEELALTTNLPEDRKQEILRKGRANFTGSFDTSGNFKSFKPEFGSTLNEIDYAREIFAGVKGSELEAVKGHLKSKFYEIITDKDTGSLILVESKSGSKVSNSKALTAALEVLNSEVDDPNSKIGSLAYYYNLDKDELKEKFLNLSNSFLTEGEVPVEYRAKYLGGIQIDSGEPDDPSAFNLTKIPSNEANSLNNQVLSETAPMAADIMDNYESVVVEDEGYNKVTGQVPISNFVVGAAIDEITDLDGAIASHLATVEGFVIKEKEDFIVNKQRVSKKEYSELRNIELNKYATNSGLDISSEASLRNPIHARAAIYGYGSKFKGNKVGDITDGTTVDYNRLSPGVISDVETELLKKYSIEGSNDPLVQYKVKEFQDYLSEVNKELERTYEYNELVPGNIKLFNEYTNDTKTKTSQNLDPQKAATNFIDEKMSTDAIIAGQYDGEDITREQLKLWNDDSSNKITIRSTASFDNRFAMSKGIYDSRLLGGTILEINLKDSKEIFRVTVQNQDAQQWLLDNAPNLTNRFETLSKAGIAKSVRMIIRDPNNVSNAIEADIVRAKPLEQTNSGYMRLVPQSNGNPAVRVPISDDYLNPDFLDDIDGTKTEREYLEKVYGIVVPDKAGFYTID